VVTLVRKLYSLGSKSLAHRKGRSILTGAGIVLGVAIFFGVLVSNATTQDGVDRLIEDFTGGADVVVNPQGAFDARISDATLAKVRALPGVRDVVGGLGLYAEVPSLRKDDDRKGFYLNGIVLDQERKVFRFVLGSGRFFRPGAAEVVINQNIAEDLSLGIGERVGITTPTGPRTVTVVGILKKEGAGRGIGGPGAFTSLAETRALVGEGAVYDGASLILSSGTNVERWVRAHNGDTPGIRFRNADDLAQGFKSFLTVFGTFLTFFAFITLFVGAFLIYLTLSMAVIERTRMYGTLRALGATRRQVRRVVLTEATALGLVSTLVGLFVGLGLAKILLALISKLFELSLPGLTITPLTVVLAVAVGVIVTLIASLIPAVRAGRLAPVEAMKGDYVGETRLTRSWIAGVALLVLGLVVAMTTSGSADKASGLTPIGVLLVLLGAVLMTPLLLRPLAAVLGRITNRMARGVGDVAVLHLVKERSRSAYTLGLIMVVMAMLFAAGGLYLSVRGVIDEIVDRQFGADLFMQANAPLDPALETKIRARPDIAHVSSLRFGFTRSSGHKAADNDEVFLLMIDPATYFDLSSFLWKDGSDAEAKEALTRGGSVLMPATYSKETGLGRGDKLILETRSGKVPFNVAGVHLNDPGPPRITVGLADGRRYFQASKPYALIADVKPSANVNRVKTSLENGIGKNIGLDVETAAENKRMAQSQVGRYFQIVYAILAVMAIVGLLGLANTLAMSVVRRFREIGILRAIGVTRSQMWRMVLVESTTLGLVAFVLSFPLGWIMTALVIRATSDGFGFEMSTVYPWKWIPFVALFGLLCAVVAAIAPGRRAARLEVVTALQYE
jgi:putative ABC transport system permease protein